MRYLIYTFFLTLVPGVFAEEPEASEMVNVPKEQWLSNLQQILPEYLCMPESPLREVYKGNNCHADMKSLYKKCVSDVPGVVIPPQITSVEQANSLGQVIAECVTAHYQGGAALDTFNLMQNKAN